MSAQAQQTQAEAQQVQLRQAKILSGIKVGMQMLEDETVIGPLKYAEGLADLKWILRNLLAGQFSINMESARPPTKPLEGRALSDYDESGSSAGAGSNGQKTAE